MNPELLYQYNEYQRQDRMEEARCARLARLAAKSLIPHPVLLRVANGMIAAGRHLQHFSLGHHQYPSPVSGD